MLYKNAHLVHFGSLQFLKEIEHSKYRTVHKKFISFCFPLNDNAFDNINITSG